MIDYAILSFSFLQGVLAFFAPCAVALLPGYISSFISRRTKSKSSLIKRALLLALFSILGFITIYSVAGLGIAFVAPLVKKYMSWIAMGMGGIITILGILMLLGKNITLSLHIKEKKTDNESKEAYIFGIAYGIGALGCLFPLFLLVATSAISAPNILIGSSYIIAYVFGMSIFMVLFSLLTVYAKDFLTKRLYKFMPYVNRVSGILLIFAGIYIIRYQANLVFF